MSRWAGVSAAGSEVLGRFSVAIATWFANRLSPDPWKRTGVDLFLSFTFLRLQESQES